jgi:hypothetical protein
MTVAPAVSSRPVNAAAAHAGEHNPHDDGLSAFLSVRPRLFGIAYRMLGSAAEAEDTVQDVWDDEAAGDQCHAVGTLAPRDVGRMLVA